MISIQPIAHEPWFPIAITIVGILFAYSVFKTLKGLPKLVMYPIIFATCAIVFFSWIYNRTEPEFMSPIIDFLAPWFPSEGDLG